MTTDREGSPQPPRKRRRPALSCEQCRRRKVKCDRNEPCGPCVRARSGLNCSYSEQYPSNNNTNQNQHEINVPGLITPPTAFGSNHAYSSSGSLAHGSHEEHRRSVSILASTTEDQTLRDVQRRLQHLEGRLSNMDDQNMVAPALRTSADEQALRDMRQRLQQLEGRLPNTDNQSTTVQASSAARSIRSTASIPATVPRLRIAPEKTKLFAPNHWLHTAEKFSGIGKFDAKEVRPLFTESKADLKTLMKDCRSLRRSVKAQQSVKLNNPVPDLKSTIPSKPICDELVQHYFRTFEQIYRIVHVPTFEHEYEQFWNDTHPVSTPFMMKLILILAIGTTFHAQEFERHRRLAQSWIHAAEWWLTGPTEKTVLNMDGLQVFCLLIIARLTNSLGESISVSTAALLRMAMVMGLHRSPKLFPTLSVFQTEMRLRLWTTIVELSVQSCLDSGVPLLLDLKDFDSFTPSNINDKDIDPESKSRSPTRASDNLKHTDTSIAIMLSKSLTARIAVIRQLNGIGQEDSYENVLKLGSELRTACRDMAAFFNSRTASGTGLLQTTDFHKNFVDMTLRRYILFLHRPFMIHARNDPGYYLSRKTCLESSMIIASYAKQLQLPHVAPNDLANVMMNCTGWLKGPLSLDVVTTLALEIITQLEDESGSFNVATGSADPLDEMADAARIPLIQSLEHIHDQSLQIVALGNPRMKRYIFLSGMLSQIQALRSGQNVDQAVYTATLDSFRQCYDVLLASQASSKPQDSIETLTNASSSWTPAEVDIFAGFNFETMTPNMALDYPSLLYFPGLGGDVVSGGYQFE